MSGSGIEGPRRSNERLSVHTIDSYLLCKDNVTIEGKLEVKKNINLDGDLILSNADCAEEFTISSSSIDAGTVVILEDEDQVMSSYCEYDKRVAGVISGAGKYKPGIILDNKDHLNNKKRLPVALMGKVYCKAVANDSAIQIGDLLTTSSIEGHAMKATDPYRAFGSVIGKALGSLEKGTGMIPVLVALQ